jgi:hypothetical protein
MYECLINLLRDHDDRRDEGKAQIENVGVMTNVRSHIHRLRLEIYIHHHFVARNHVMNEIGFLVQMTSSACCRMNGRHQMNREKKCTVV